MMMSRLPLRLALRIVRAVALLVPAPTRGDWRREWEAELQHQAAHLQRRRHQTWRTNMDLISRAIGSVPDAAWIRRQLTLDADAVHDAAHGLRILFKTPGFTAIALIVFAIGIGATTAMISVADAFLIRPLPVRQPDRVVTVWQRNRATGLDRLDVAPGNAIDWLKRARSFEAAAIAEPFRFNINVEGREPEYLTAARVSEQFFTVLGAPMLHGRAFLPEEYRRRGPRVAIFSHALWTARFGSDPSIVGTAVRLDEGNAYTVVGVVPPGLELRLFDDRSRRPETSIWLPKQGFEEFERNLRGQAFWNVLGRLRPGVSAREAQAEFDALSTQLAREYPQTNASIAAQVVPLRAHLVGSLRDVLPLLLGAAALLLIVACANVANLQLARGAARGREFAVRHALGASRVRLVRQMLVESLLLAAGGGAVGLVLARWALDMIAALRPRDVALVDHIPIDARAAVIACGVTILAAVIAGVTPSIQLSRAAAASALRGGRSGSRRGVRGALVVVEVAAALVLAVGAGLLVRSFMLIQRVDPGFSRDHVSVLQVFASRRLDTPQKRVVFFQQALDRMRALPGVVAAGGVTSMPFGEARIIVRGPLAIEGRPAAPGEEALVYTTAVTGDYFQAMDVPLLRGRIFDASDTAASRQVVLVSQRAVRQFWLQSEPVGSRVRFRFSGKAYDAEVVGVVGDVRHEALDAPAAAEVFVPYSQSGFYGLTLVVRTAPESPANLQTLKQQIWALDPLQSVFNTARLEQLIAETLIGRRFNLFLLGGFALATLVLATAGVYGVMSFSTVQRTREFGVRMALGAARGDIVRLVLGEGLKLAVAGVLVGVIVALLLTRLLRALLFGVTSTDPVTFLFVSLGLLMVAAAACYLPASRALKVDPAKTLRFD
jgi:putative ABC transport system permease protein